MDDPGAPIVPIAPDDQTPSDTVSTRTDGGRTDEYETAEWGAPLVPEF